MSTYATILTGFELAIGANCKNCENFGDEICGKIGLHLSIQCSGCPWKMSNDIYTTKFAKIYSPAKKM